MSAVKKRIAMKAGSKASGKTPEAFFICEPQGRIGFSYLRSILAITLFLIFSMLVFSFVKREAKYTGEPPQERRKESLTSKQFGPYIIACVVDGDTIVLNTGDKVRMKGIDAPELHHPVIPAQRFGEEARDYLKNLAEGKKCFLEYDAYDSKDMYGRALAYVYVENTDLNAEMLLRGYACLYTFKPFSKKTAYAACEREAREKHRGLWNFDLKDGRITRLVNSYQSLSDAGKTKLDDNFKELLNIYPAKGD